MEHITFTQMATRNKPSFVPCGHLLRGALCLWGRSIFFNVSESVSSIILIFEKKAQPVQSNFSKYV